MRPSDSALVPFVILLCATACGGSTPVEPELPNVDAVTFVAGVDHPYFPLKVGTKWVYEAEGPEGVERIEVEVLAETREIQGVTATVVRDTASLHGEVVEDTWDWFAQDDQGNVWYLGEDTCEFENGACVTKVGAWEWGVDGGIVMPAVPEVNGEPYYQEYYVGEAEDYGEVVAVGATVDVPAGKWTDCIKTHDASTLDPDLDEYKYYCRGVGLALTEEPDLQEKLISFEP